MESPTWFEYIRSLRHDSLRGTGDERMPWALRILVVILVITGLQPPVRFPERLFAAGRFPSDSPLGSAGSTLLQPLQQGSAIAPAARREALDLDQVRLPRFTTPVASSQTIELLSWSDQHSVNTACTEIKVQLADGPASPGDWWLAQIGAPVAWEAITGTTHAVVAVVDAGLDLSHPELAGQLWVNPGEIPGNGLDDDHNGHTDDVHGWNMVDDNADLSDNTGHGTAMAGIIAAAENGEGVTGVCPVCRIMVVKVTGPDGLAKYDDIAQGVTYAAQNGADVINVSLSGSVNAGPLWKSVATASEQAVVVSGAGNDGGTSPVYPAAYDRVLAVASTGRDDTRLESSNFGSWVDVAAPGSDVRTCFRGGGYRSQSGTSVAAAIVSGLAGLLRCQNHDLSPGVVRAQIMRTADPICREQPGCTPGLGSGRINASRALVTDAPSSLAYYSQTTDGRSGFEEERGSTVSWQAGMHNGRSDATSVCATLSTKGPHLTFSQCW